MLLFYTFRPINSDIFDIVTIDTVNKSYTGPGSTTPFTNTLEIDNSAYKYLLLSISAFTEYIGTGATATVGEVAGLVLIKEIYSGRLTDDSSKIIQHYLYLYRVQNVSKIAITITGKRGGSAQNYKGMVNAKAFCMK